MGSFLSALVSGDSAGTPAEASSNAPPSLVVALHEKARYDSQLAQLNDNPRLAVIFFSASWCGPCRFIEPVVEQMASKFDVVSFIKIDVDELADVAGEWKVDKMPTFVLAKRGKEVTRVVGANKDELEKNIQKHIVS